MLQSRRMYIPPLALLGPGCVKEIGPEIKKMNVKKALVVTDQVLLEIGVSQEVLKVLDESAIAYAVFADVKPNPTIKNVYDGLKALEENGCDFVISIGGGSPQDCGKAIAILATNPGDLRDYEGVNKTQNKGLPIVAINTTAGTASEATINYVITDEERKVKMVLVDSNSLATIAVNDPELMMKKPKALTAATGMDALTHAIEGYLTKGASALTDALNLESIRMISSSLRDAVNDRENLEARSKMAYGQYITGMAFSNCGLGIVHSMAHQLGGLYDLPHGVCNAVLLPHIVKYNAAFVGDKLRNVAVAMGEAVDGLSVEKANEVAIKAIEKLSKDVGIPSGLAALGVKEEDLAQMADMALADACTPGNPRTPNKEEIITIYKEAL
ncbi:alcohol dehydrogenase [Anaerosolibacter carboniphilus]|uniref:Alcohol dehydrogenase n=1 Tax=Anaerosolibacter carboniphilus TaxID=1417629 RepID=A0A841KW66_9FIRM|nr:iron-containing alcohol dehydrogenase [Anaerosolibacter carboniphilus]MBB6214429.1 alcohol dehydrogenase [Anaerosolibacter carboniphilus]